MQIRRPLLARDTKAVGMGLVRFLTIIGHAFSYKAMLSSVLRAQIGGRFAPPDPELEIRFITKNPSHFKLVFKTQKPETRPPRTEQKRPTSNLTFIKNDCV